MRSKSRAGTWLAGLLILFPAAAWSTEECKCSAQSVSLPIQRVATFFGASIGGRVKVLDIYASDFEMSPSWDPKEGGEPPLTVGEAIRVATAEMLDFLEDPETWKLGDVTLRQFPEGIWTYNVHWSPVDRNSTGAIIVPVLMSGQVIPLDRLKDQSP